METEKKYALLIDADNVSPKYMDLVLRETKTLGDVSIRRIYGDWTEIGKHSWKECLLENSLTPIQQYSYTTGKNASDSAMIIDAMDILYTREIDGFVIVSSDSDFTKLAMRLRESGKYVVVTPLKQCFQHRALSHAGRPGDHKCFSLLIQTHSSSSLISSGVMPRRGASFSVLRADSTTWSLSIMSTDAVFRP